MSESVIADFFGSFHAPSTPAGEPVSGRVVCSPRRLVLAADSQTKFQIPLATVVDIGVGTVPDDLAEFFDSTVTIAFERDGRHQVAAVEAANDDIRKFSTVLFTAILEGMGVSVCHPARRDGRLTDAPFRTARVDLKRNAIRLERDDRPVRIGLDDLVGFDHQTSGIEGTDRPTLVVTATRGDSSATTLIGARSGRKLSLLGRYLRLEYSEVAADMRDHGLDELESAALFAAHADAGDPSVTLASVLDVDEEGAAAVRSTLAEADLLESADPAASLTRRGRVAVESVLDPPV